MNWQLLAVILIVSCAALYLARQTWQSFAGRKGSCGGGCGCSSKPPVDEACALISPQQITLRPPNSKPL
jgi:hypothetical protein